MTPALRLAVELGARVAELDGTKLSPMLCGRDESGERILDEEAWIFELKLDGVRIIADKRGDRVSLGYRKGRGATDSYPEIAEAVRSLAEERVVLDGEIVAFDAQGRPDFQRLGTRIQSRGSDAKRAASTVPVAYVVFDVLAIGDRDLTRLPIEARKAILERVLGEPDRRVVLHPTFDDGKALFLHCRERHLEGVVAKRAQSIYRPNDRSQDWVKIKCERDVDLVVVGWAEGEGKRSHLGSLDVAAYEGGRLVVRGAVGSGLDEDTIDALLERLEPLEVPKAVAEGKYRLKKSRHHVRPEVVVSIRYLGLSNEGVLRFPVFRGIRHDLRPEDCTFDGSAPREADERRVTVNAPSLVVLPDGTTKGALCSYYEAVAPRLLPYVKGRVCPLIRAVTKGDAAGRQTAWPLPGWAPSWVRAKVVRTEGEEIRGVVADDVDALLFGIEAGAVSFAMVPSLDEELADFVALRVASKRAGEGRDRTARIARRARELAKALGLPAFAKIAGIDRFGFDVLVPVGRAPVKAAQVFGALFARLLAAEAEKEDVLVSRLEAPIAPYAIDLPMAAGRPATVSLPIDWAELDDFALVSATPAAVLGRFEEVATDPMAELLEAHVDFAAAVAAIEPFVAAAQGKA
ncbi:MAG: non-homologous end-joining DNA ligase [Labilithrix sp.]|nr:non-homologous end-joining DNA ligase [Labilithrix sp.]